ncbi:Homoserine O-acetyltransferase [Candidatus Terasakiella magnetica]|uniref:Homoserine O-acetyltransferase n=1 Tax=Candidatus Terasakiella magnetica TaxID=1867952 RepID=A0A1C3RDY9_9PROT|nr:homoserine O-acetyltransferase [Candidatus Terasakiella magnetica]SCA55475.1 Homoserine O-acetyltransferase [Candidatus Terasakiella magnetica]
MSNETSISINPYADDFPTLKAILGVDVPLRLDCGVELSSFPLAYQTYGTLNKDKTNAVLVTHALTGDQFVADVNPVTGKPGWWTTMVGPGKPIDTDKYFVICSNVLGGCMGTIGPAAINPETNQPWGVDFPVITIGDMVRAQALLLDYLEIETLFSVIGGSMGGMQALEWAAAYPERVFSCLPIATAATHSAQNIAFYEVGRQAIMADPDWCAGRYLAENKKPRAGLSVARMAAHITYMSEGALTQKFGRRLQDREKVTFGFEADFQIESYLRHQGISFVERFDANSYLYVTRAMDYFDLATTHGKGKLAEVFKETEIRFCVVSFSSDWHYLPEESRVIVRGLTGAAANVSYVDVVSDKGHDAFLLKEPEFESVLYGFLNGAALRRGLINE